jgi:hypothetical protein
MSSSTPRVQRLRKRRKEGVLMCTTVEVGAGGIELLVGNGLLGPNEKNNKAAIQRAVEDALEQWSAGQGSRTRVH